VKKRGPRLLDKLRSGKEQCDKDKTIVDKDDEGDAILVGRGTLIARTEEPIEDVTTTRRV